jgi:cellobiose phosphorylase
MYRLIIESLLGIQREGTTLRLVPKLPEAWPAFSARYRFGASSYEISVRRGPSSPVLLDGMPQPDASIALVDDQQTHRVEVVVPTTTGG